MKILLIQDHLRSGGTERQTVLLANAFTAAGHATTLLTFRPGGALAASVAPTVTRLTLQAFDTRLDWFAPGLRRGLELLRADVILCMGRMANCYGEFIVRTIRDCCPNTAVIATMRTGKSLPWPFRRSLRHVRHIIANSGAAKANLTGNHGCRAGKITVIHNSLIFSSGPATGRNEALRESLGAGPGTKVLLNVGMFRKEKNQRELIADVAALPMHYDWQLWLAGQGPTRAACEQLARRRGVGPRVKFLGFQVDPSPLYAAADLAVHASWSESLSNFLIEAQAHGLPVVAYQAQGIEECFVPDDTGAVIPRGQNDAFRAAILRLAEADAACRDRARAFARTHFAAARQVQAHLDLFTRLGNI